MRTDLSAVATLDADELPSRRARYLFTLLVFLLPTLLLAASASWLLPDEYRASATLLPQVPFNPTAGLSAQLGMPQAPTDLSRLGRLAGNPMLDRFKILLRSRSLAEQVIRGLGLTRQRGWIMPRAGWQESGEAALDEDQALYYLRRQVTIDDTREGALIVNASAPEPAWSARIANAYVDQLSNYLNGSVISAVKKGRLFIEGQLARTSTALAASEDALRAFQSRHRTVALPEQTRAAVEAASKVAADIADVEVTLGVKATYLTDQDKEVMQLKQRLAELRRQQQLLVKGEAPARAAQGDFQLPLAAVPAVGVELARLQRDVATQEKIYGLLTEQYELAKIIESREDISFQVVDRAVPPRAPAGPNRLLIVLAAGLVAAALAVLYLVARARWDGMAFD